MYVSTLTLVFRLLSCHTLKKTSKNINLEKELDDDQYHHFQIKQLSRSYIEVSYVAFYTSTSQYKQKHEQVKTQM